MGFTFNKKWAAAFDVDAMNTFTPLCPGELPVPEGHLIVDELNAQAQYAKYRVGSKDAHCLAAIYNATPLQPQFSPIEGEPNADIRWNVHGIPGTYGFQLLKGLPAVTEYDFFIWKGIEPNMHPYGACYHDLAERLPTGVIDWAATRAICTFIVGGLATDYCVKLTVEQLLRGFDVILNLGACRGITTEGTAKAVEELKVKGAIIVNCAKEIEAMCYEAGT